MFFKMSVNYSIFTRSPTYILLGYFNFNTIESIQNILPSYIPKHFSTRTYRNT
jgi:hypothetical protein